MKKTIPAPHCIYRDFLDASSCKGLLEWAVENEPQFEPTRVYPNEVDPSQRISQAVRKFGPIQPVLRQRVAEILPKIIGDLRITSFELSDIELELVANNDGAHFGTHIDTQTGDTRQRTDRLVSAVYYFHRVPKAFSGGALRLHSFVFGGDKADERSTDTDVQPEHNSLVVFPSWVSHEVLPVSCPSGRFADSRFNVNCWFRR